MSPSREGGQQLNSDFGELRRSFREHRIDRRHVGLAERTPVATDAVVHLAAGAVGIPLRGEKTDGGAVIRDLEHATIFIVRLDEGASVDLECGAEFVETLLGSDLCHFVRATGGGLLHFAVCAW